MNFLLMLKELRPEFRNLSVMQYCACIADDLSITKVSVYRFMRDNNLPLTRQALLVEKYKLPAEMLLPSYPCNEDK